MPDHSPDSNLTSGTVSQPSRCIPAPSLDSSQSSGTANQQKPTHLPPHTSPHGAPSGCIPDNSLETSTKSTQCSSSIMEKKQKTQKVKRIWQELTRDENNVVKVMKVVDFGLTRSARTRTGPKLRHEEENKTLLNTGVKKKRRKIVSIHLTPQKLQDEKKKTSLKKVKIASSKKSQNLDKNMPQSPGLKRLQPARIDKIVARTSPLSPKPEKSQNAFNRLLLSWENLSTRNQTSLTPAVRTPRSDEAAENQSEQALQVLQKKMRQASDASLDRKFGK